MAPVLFALYEADDCIIKDLAERTKRSAPALNSLLGRLEKSGVVAMRSCEQDGRAVRVRLTAKGRQIAPKVRELHRRVVAAVERDLIAADVSRAKRAAVIDQHAAVFILQGALDRLANMEK